ncbi:cytochrome P450 [Rhizoctonia solani]|uniref:Cytochrome P450 n=1 Tax=Rhizoctonia solani TaxID=456999 RepID=A0A8H7H8H4_9AGAM|nr:cytochrome P450 [Rhizoctonia solani]KAF8756638.1 cytochrome P450 [Rhizoctonia solani]
MLSYSEIGLVATAIGSSWYIYHKTRGAKGRLPPSPSGSYPFIGHALVLPNEREHLVYNKWCKELHSDIISLTAAGQTIVVLDSVETATDLLDRRSRIYSDRPQLRVISDPDLFDWGNNTGSAPYGPRWKKQRRITHELLKPSANAHNFELFEKETYAMLKRLAVDPKEFGNEIRRTVAGEILLTVYGYTVEGIDDRLVRDNVTAIENFTFAAIPGNFMVNFLPWLKYVPEWLPGTQWKRNLKEWRRLKDRISVMPYNWTKAQIASGSATHSMVKVHLASIESNPQLDRAEEEDHLLWATSTIFSAAADTTHTTLMWFVLLMVQHPEIQARAQEEIDRVTNSERLPKISDRDLMPYVQAIVQEVLRWQPPVPLGFPHASTEDDEYRGYFIPKASIMAMTRDESVYASPERFDPTRFLDPNTPRAPVFGFGRRSCPGNHYAEASLFIMFASLLATFNIRPKTNPVTGEEEMPKVKATFNAIVSYIEPFECSIKPRSNVYKELIDSA